MPSKIMGFSIWKHFCTWSLSRILTFESVKLEEKEKGVLRWYIFFTVQDGITAATNLKIKNSRGDQITL